MNISPLTATRSAHNFSAAQPPRGRGLSAPPGPETEAAGFGLESNSPPTPAALSPNGGKSITASVVGP